MTVLELVVLVLAGACFVLTALGVPSGRATNLLGAGGALTVLFLIMQGWPATT